MPAAPALFAGQIGLLSGWGVFSTLRVARGALFALGTALGPDGARCATA